MSEFTDDLNRFLEDGQELYWYGFGLFPSVRPTKNDVRAFAEKILEALDELPEKHNYLYVVCSGDMVYRFSEEPEDSTRACAVGGAVIYSTTSLEHILFQGGRIIDETEVQHLFEAAEESFPDFDTVEVVW